MSFTLRRSGVIISLSGVLGGASSILFASLTEIATGWPPMPFEVGHEVVFELMSNFNVDVEKPGRSIGTKIMGLP